MKELADHLTPIVWEAEEDELAKRFDQFCYTMELEVLKNGSVAAQLVQETRSLPDAPSKRTTIPMVGERMPLIKQVQGAAYWVELSLTKLENLRHLIRFIQTDKRPPIYTNLDNEVLALAEPKALLIKTSSPEA